MAPRNRRTRPKPIVYFDQNFASGLAKAAVDLRDWKDPDKEFYKQLLELLRQKTANNRIICPTSVYHSREADQSLRIRDFFWHVVKELSCDLSFNEGAEILFNQLCWAAGNYNSSKTDSSAWWKTGLNRDPRQDVNLKEAPSTQVYVPTHVELLKFESAMNNEAAREYQNYKDLRGEELKSSSNPIHDLMEQLFDEWISLSSTLTVPVGVNPDLFKFSIPVVINWQSAFLDIFDQPEDLKGFLNSVDFKGVPYLYIRATLMVADITKYPSKQASPSFATDLDILASVLPYVDVLATERYMAELIRQTNLNQQVGVSVFSMRNKDELIEYLDSV